jgi:hypothetical protein
MPRTGSPIALVVPLLFAVPLTHLSPGQAYAQVAINEVLYDPEGPDTGHEFVEIVNCGHAGVILTGWVLETGNGAHPDDWTVEWIGGDLDYLAVGEILLIGEGDVVPTPDHVTALDLQNGPDGVRLLDGDRVVDTVGWGEPLFAEYYEGRPAGDVASGSSLARSPDCFDHNDNAADLVACASPTPGARNAPTFDLSIDVRDAWGVVAEAGRPLVVRSVVRNVGSVEAAERSFSVALSVDSGAAPEAVVTPETPLAPRDSLELGLEWAAAAPGYHTLTVRVALPEDENASNDEDCTTAAVGGPAGIVVLNEIMHSPAEGGTEWVELVNVFDETVRVDGWSLGDGVDAFPMQGADTEPRVDVSPGAFLVVAKDAALVDDSCPAAVITTDGWEALSADDTVVLLDGHGTPIDRVGYERSWGGARGVSLERVRPGMASEDPNNWGSSVAPAGSTPGLPNSIHLPERPARGTLTVFPNPFTPDGDGVDDRTVVRFELPVARATARLSVFDLRGRLRGRLLDREAVASRRELIWDGAGDDGSPLPSGLYVLFLEAISAREGVLVEAKAAVAIVR